jgi:hypothetical protein
MHRTCTRVHEHEAEEAEEGDARSSSGRLCRLHCRSPTNDAGIGSFIIITIIIITIAAGRQ